VCDDQNREVAGHTLAVEKEFMGELHGKIATITGSSQGIGTCSATIKTPG
jgi:hypothetical protein